MSRYVDLDEVIKWKKEYCNSTSITHCDHDCAECYYRNGISNKIRTEAKYLKDYCNNTPCRKCPFAILYPSFDNYEYICTLDREPHAWDV